MNPTAAAAGDKDAPTPPPAAGGCARCWAANYCAVFSLAGPQPPPACPLTPKRPARPRPGKPALHDTEF